MMGLTPSQAKAKAYIAGFINLNGFAPTYEQIRSALRLGSKSGVNRVIVELEARGHLRRNPGCARALEIITGPNPLREASDAELLAEVKRRALHP